MAFKVYGRWIVVGGLLACRTKVLKENKNFGVHIKFKLGDSKGERAKFNAAAQRCISYKPDFKKLCQ